MMKIRTIPALVLSLVAMPIVAISFLAYRGSFKVDRLPTLGEVTPFKLTDQTGKEVNLDSLRGKVWVANFIFTSCTSQCPLIMMEAKKVSKALLFKENFRMVSITIDPETDTPKQLTDYANKWQADPYKWIFLTGSFNEIKNLMQKGLKVPTEVEGMEVMHSSKLVLVDHLAMVRGYYSAEDGHEMKKLLKDAKQLLKKAF
ncbi:MAG: SCO family protein [Proteobacteria bacterium]|nr:SCO family protein [Pseudomonadota bacterium]NDC23268.1 SCO family protein [Pseudomonadota bacterium]NDD03486.1 SCO family protein [Pseudomonadota bacterium]NDG25873.1 SCO family protein [Pseudomonadota bacterium]